jgi:hypothetical protein
MSIFHILLPTGFAALALLGLNAAIRRSLRAPRVRSAANPADYGLSYTGHRIPTQNSKYLNAWWLPATNENAPTIIGLHGWGGNAAMMLPIAQPLHAAGFALLFIESRCHGASDDDSSNSHFKIRLNQGGGSRALEKKVTRCQADRDRGV